MLDLGLGYNLSQRIAVGLAGEVTTVGDLAIRGRVRTWLPRSLAFDVAPGLVIAGDRSVEFPTLMPAPDRLTSQTAVARPPGFSATAALSLGDWILLFIQSDVFRYQEVQLLHFQGSPEVGYQEVGFEKVRQPGTIVEHWVGARLGSYPGLVAQLATLVALSVYGLLLPRD